MIMFHQMRESFNVLLFHPLGTMNICIGYIKLKIKVCSKSASSSVSTLLQTTTVALLLKILDKLRQLSRADVS